MEGWRMNAPEIDQARRSLHNTSVDLGDNTLLNGYIQTALHRLQALWEHQREQVEHSEQDQQRFIERASMPASYVQRRRKQVDQLLHQPDLSASCRATRAGRGSCSPCTTSVGIRSAVRCPNSVPRCVKCSASSPRSSLTWKLTCRPSTNNCRASSRAPWRR